MPKDGDKLQSAADHAAQRAEALWGLRGAPSLLKRLDRYLASNGATVATPVRSRQGRHVESITTNQGLFHATAFNKTPGEQFRMDRHWHPEIHRNLGALMGHIHALKRDYRPSQGIARREAWHEDSVYHDPERYLPKGDAIAMREFDEVMEWAKSLPTTDDVFGLVHSDMNHSNFFVDNGNRLTLFDFDDMPYHWYAYDLSVSFFQLLWSDDFSRSIALSQKDWYYGDLLEGYRGQYDLGEEWIRRIPGFVRFRRIEMYVWLHKAVDLSTLNAQDRIAFKRLQGGLSWKEPLLYRWQLHNRRGRCQRARTRGY